MAVVPHALTRDTIQRLRRDLIRLEHRIEASYRDRLSTPRQSGPRELQFVGQVTTAITARQDDTPALGESTAGTGAVRLYVLERGTGKLLPRRIEAVRNYTGGTVAVDEWVAVQYDDDRTLWALPPGEGAPPVEFNTVVGQALVAVFSGTPSPITGGTLSGGGTLPPDNLVSYDPITGELTVLQNGYYRFDMTAELGALVTTPPPSKTVGVYVKIDLMPTDVLMGSGMILTDLDATQIFAMSGQWHEFINDAPRVFQLIADPVALPSGAGGTASITVSEWSVERLKV